MTLQDQTKYNFDKVLERNDYFAIKTHPQLDSQEGTIACWIADMDFQSPKPVVDALVERMQFPNYGYTRIPERLFTAYQHWLAHRHQWEIEREWLLPNIGILHQMKFVYQTFAEPGDKALIMPPLYPPFRNQIKAVGGEFINNELILTDEGYRIDWEDLEEKLQRSDVTLLYLCNPHNPAGRVWTKDELRRIGELCVANDVLIFSDDVHMDLTFDSHPYTPIASISEEIADRTITAVAPNKTFNIAGFGTAMCVVSNPELRSKLEDFINRRRYNGFNIGSITAAIAAYESGENWLDQVLDYIQDNIAYVTDYFKENIPNVRVVPTDGTYMLWLDFRSLGLSDEELDDFLLGKAKVWMNSGYTFGEGGSGFMRFNIATQRATLERIVKQIEQAVNELE